jgi:RHS repeat-associated protein
MGVVNYFCIEGELISETRNGVESDYIPDTLGNTIKLVNMSGAVTDEFEYWPYGELRSHTGTSVTPFTFGGTLGYYSDQWGGEYVRARELEPVRVSWVSIDPHWPRELAFVYVRSNPTNYTDQSGYSPTWLQSNGPLLHSCIATGLGNPNCSGLNKNQVSKMMRCIFQCELGDVPGNPMNPDPGHPGGGRGPGRLTGQPQWGGFSYPRTCPNWRTDPCQNIAASVSLLCFDIKFKRGNPPTLRVPPSYKPGCFNSCMGS